MSTASAAGWRTRVALLVTAASGAASLAYQIVWTRQGALWLGHESAAVLAVVAAFFGGLASGALCGGGAVASSRHPVRWYVCCEGAIAAWALLLLAAFGPITDLLLRVIGSEPSPLRQWFMAFVGMFLLLLPATFSMGLTLPAMERLVPARHRQVGSFSRIYAANCAGALAGVVAAAFWAVPGVGMRRLVLACVAINVCCALLAAGVLHGEANRGSPGWTRPDNAHAITPRARTARRFALARLAITGLLGIGYEVLVLRVLAQVTEQTVYTFAAALAVYIAGTTLGAAAFHRWRVSGSALARGDNLLTMLAVGCLVSTTALWWSQEISEAVRSLSGAGMGMALVAEAALGVVAFAVPTFFMGAVFSQLCNAARTSGSNLGVAIGINALGAAAAPVLFGVIAVPVMGLKFGLLCIASGYLLLRAKAGWLRPAGWIAAGAIVSVAWAAPPLAFVNVPEGGRILSYIEGATASVSVVEDERGTRRLHIDNRQQEGSNASYWFDARQAWLPLLLHPEPRDALFLGLGTGVTAAAAMLDPALDVDVVELLPEVIESSRYFTDAFVATPHHSARRLVAADARRYVRASQRTYDVIVADNFHPARSGAGSLYTVEHFEAVRKRLAARGLFCQWLPLHQLDLDSLRSITRSFLAAYPDAAAILATNSVDTPVVGLIGRAGPLAIDVASVRSRRQQVAAAASLDGLNFEDELAVLGAFVAGANSLREFAAVAELNTDDHPVVSYSAPRITYAPDSHPRDRLVWLLDQWHVRADEVVAPAPLDVLSRLTAYWSARDVYIETGSRMRPAADLQQLLASVREPLLAVVRISSDFRPALMPLRQMANALDAMDHVAAARLRREIEEAIGSVDTTHPEIMVTRP